MTEQFSLSGRVALVTGSTAGIGRAIANGFAGAGARVAINGRDPKRVSDVAGSIDGAFAAPFDIDDHSAADAVLENILRDVGRLDILVCNVGARDRRTISEIEPTAFQELLRTNAVSPYQLARTFAQKLPHPEKGRLIFISSVAAIRPFRGDPAYAASKAAVESLVRSFCFEFAPRGITANAIAPGFVATDSNADLADEATVQDFVETRVPSRRWARPEEIANAAVFLASDAASYINGHVLTVDAGLSVCL